MIFTIHFGGITTPIFGENHPYSQTKLEHNFSHVERLRLYSWVFLRDACSTRRIG